MTAWANIDLAVEAMRRGARDFIQKPWENERLLAILELTGGASSRAPRGWAITAAQNRLRYHKPKADPSSLRQRLQCNRCSAP